MDAGVPAQPSPQPPPSTAAVVAAGGGGLKRPRPTAGSNSSNTTTTIKIASANVSDETRASNLRAPVTPPNTGTTSNSTTGSSTPTTTTSSSINTDNINRRNAELNDLLQLSASHEVNFAMTSDAIVVALAEVVLLDCLQWNSTLTTKNNNNNNNNGDLETSSDNKDDDTTSMRLFRSAKAWTTPPTPLSQAWAEHCCQYSFSHSTTNNEKEENNTVVAICEAIAMILRNFSFTGANLRLLAYSPDVLHTLTAFLYIGTKNKSYRQLRRSSSSNNNNNSSNSPDSSTSSLVLTSLQTLLNVARYLDVTGQQLLKDKLFYDGTNTAAVEGPAVPNASEYGKCVTGAWNGFGIGWLAKRLDTKEDSIENVPTELLLSLTEDYLEAVWSIFPALHAVFVVDNTNQPSRAVFLVTLKLLQELINTARVGLVGAVQDETLNLLPGQEYKIPNIRSVLVNVPDAMLEKLSDLLFVPRHGPDSLDYIDPVNNTETKKTSTLEQQLASISSNYDATVDIDARDRALEVLVPLLELDSPRMAARLGRRRGSCQLHTRLYDALVPILTTAVGRSDASLIATQLFRELSKARSENKRGLLYVQSRLVELASRDERVSLLVWKDLYPPTSTDDDVGGYMDGEDPAE